MNHWLSVMVCGLSKTPQSDGVCDIEYTIKFHSTVRPTMTLYKTTSSSSDFAKSTIVRNTEITQRKAPVKCETECLETVTDTVATCSQTLKLLREYIRSHVSVNADYAGSSETLKRIIDFLYQQSNERVCPDLHCQRKLLPVLQ